MLGEFLIEEDMAGADVIRTTGIPSGTIYPLLMRFEQAQILESTWETDKPEDMHRPRRRVYRLTKGGAKFAMESLDSVAGAKERKKKEQNA